MPSSNYNVMRQAMLAAVPVSFMYKGHLRLTCPHVIGFKRGHEHVLVFQYGGGSSSGLPPRGEWRCLNVSETSNVRIISGAWKTDPKHSQTQTCVDQVDVELWVNPYGTPYVKRA
jgi:hypothetical protein